MAPGSSAGLCQWRAGGRCRLLAPGDAARSARAAQGSTAGRSPGAGGLCPWARVCDRRLVDRPGGPDADGPPPPSRPRRSCLDGGPSQASRTTGLLRSVHRSASPWRDSRRSDHPRVAGVAGRAGGAPLDAGQGARQAGRCHRLLPGRCGSAAGSAALRLRRGGARSGLPAVDARHREPCPAPAGLSGACAHAVADGAAPLETRRSSRRPRADRLDRQARLSRARRCRFARPPHDTPGIARTVRCGQAAEAFLGRERCRPRGLPRL